MRALLIMLFPGFLLSCSGSGTSTGNPVTVSFDSFSTILSKSVQVDAFAISEVRMCFKRLRFKPSDSDDNTNIDNIDLEIGEVTLSSSGTELTTISVPEGVYERIEFDLEKDCNGYSVFVDNGHVSAPFQTDDRITIKFTGSFTVENTENSLLLGIQNIMNALDTATDDSELKTLAEGASGTIN